MERPHDASRWAQRGSPALTPVARMHYSGAMVSGRLAVLAFVLATGTTLTACAIDDAAIADELVVDPVQACPIPAGGAIAGHEADFYRCVDDVVGDGAGCGNDGYLLGYGARYAERFYRVTRPRMSARGQRWIDDVLVCLQEELQVGIDASTGCDDIRSIAFDSHPGCYVGAGFCTLPLVDVLQVVWTIDVRDWFGSSAARQAVETAIGCGRQHASILRVLFPRLAP
jgi:hypothetical protein